MGIKLTVSSVLPAPDSVELIVPKEQDVIESSIRKLAVADFYNSMVSVKLSFQTSDENQVIDAHVAETSAQKVAGLEAATSLDDKEGLWFPFDPPENAQFHMGAVRFPIDIIFFEPTTKFGLRIAKIVHNVQPGSMDRWSNPNTSGVLEVNGGTCKQLGIKIGTLCKAKIVIKLNN